jgi:type II secretion system protein N
MVSVKAIFAYLLYTLLAVILFLYLLFPAQGVKALMNARLAEIDPSLSMEADTLRPALPPGLKMTGVDLNSDSRRLAHVDVARVTPYLTTLLSVEKKVRFQGQIAGGTFQGMATIDNSATGGRLRAETDLSQIQLGQLDRIKSIDQFSLAGSLDGHITHDDARAPGGMTNGTLTISGLRIGLKSPIFGITDLTMDRTDADFSVRGQRMQLQALTFDGPMAEGKISGTIELRKPLEQSRLNLTGNAKPHPELIARLQTTVARGFFNTRTLGTRGLIFRIRGSLDSPSVSLR